MKNYLGDGPNLTSNKVLYILENIKEDWGKMPAWNLAFNNFLQ